MRRTDEPDPDIQRTEFRLLGTVDVLSPTGPVAVRSPQQRALLARLLLDGDRAVHLDEIVAAIWAGRPPRTFRHAVHTRIHDLRRFLGGLGPITVDGIGDTYRLDPGAATVDVGRFRAAATRGHELLVRGETGPAERALRDGLECWRGDPVADVATLRDSDWAVGLLQERAAVEREWAWAGIGAGRPQHVADRLAIARRADPLSEHLAALHMVALARTGDRSAALREFRRLAEELDRELQVRPASWLARLHDTIDTDAEDLLAPLAAHLPVTAGRAHSTSSVRGPATAGPPAEATALIGRDGELGLLREALRRATTHGEPQLVTLIGEAGIGKTRLLDTLVDTATAPDLLRYTTTCLEGDRFDPLRPLATVLRERAGLTAATPDHRLAAGLAAACPADARHLLPVLERVVGLEPPGPARPLDPAALADAWCRFVFPDDGAPVLLAVDDLHRAGDAVLDVVEQLTERAHGRPVLVVAAARPELLLRRPSWCGGRPDTATTTLAPLSDADSATVLRALLGGRAEPSPADLGLAAGNPFFLEELARARAGGLDGSGAVRSIATTIAATLDVLDPHDRAVLRRGSVLRSALTAEAVAAAADVPVERATASLDRLRRLWFLRRSRGVEAHPARSAAFVFRHDVLRDTMRDTLGDDERRAAHLRAARWLAGHEGATRPAVTAGAAQYVEALELWRLPDAPPWWPDAARAVLAAVEGSAWLLFVDEALRWLRVLTGSCDPDRFPVDGAAVHLCLGEYLIALGQDGRTPVQQARDLYEQHGSAVDVALTDLPLARFEHYYARLPGAGDRLDAAVAVLRSAPPTPHLSRMLRLLAGIHEETGRLGDAADRALEATVLADRIGDPFEMTMCRFVSAILQSVRAAPGALDELHRLVEELDARSEHRVVQRINLVEACLRGGELGQARTAWNRLEALIGGEPWSLARAQARLHDVRLRFWEGRWSGAADDEAPSLPGTVAWQWWVVTAEDHLLRGRPEEAAHAAQTALDAVGHLHPSMAQVPALACVAAAARATGAPDADELAARTAAAFGEVMPYAAGAHVAAALASAGWTAADLDPLPATPWRAAVAAVLAGDPAEAAHRYERIGSLPDALLCWERAAADERAGGPVRALARAAVLRRKLGAGVGSSRGAGSGWTYRQRSS